MLATSLPGSSAIADLLCACCRCLQPAARDFNEEDYMDGDLMDEELVE